jgi:hypothetical protein
MWRNAKGASMKKLLLVLSLVSFVSAVTGCSLKAPKYSPELGGFLVHGKESQKKNSQVAQGGEGRSGDFKG